MFLDLVFHLTKSFSFLKCFHLSLIHFQPGWFISYIHKIMIDLVVFNRKEKLWSIIFKCSLVLYYYLQMNSSLCMCNVTKIWEWPSFQIIMRFNANQLHVCCTSLLMNSRLSFLQIKQMQSSVTIWSLFLWCSVSALSNSTTCQFLTNLTSVTFNQFPMATFGARAFY